MPKRRVDTRRRFAYRPNLLIVDGGQPQVAAAKRALDDAGVTGIRCAESPSDSRRSGFPTPITRSSCPATATRCS